MIHVVVEEAAGPLWLRALRAGDLVCSLVEPDFGLDGPDGWECASLHDGVGRLVQLPLEGAEAELRVRMEPVRVLVSTLEHPSLDRSAPFREVARRMAELDFDQERVGLVDLEVWHLLPTAALLHRDTPPERLPRSYPERVAAALETLDDCHGSQEMFALCATTWAQHWLGDDADPPTLEALGAEVLPRLRERLGGARYAAALSEGATKVRQSRDHLTIAVMNVGDEVAQFRENARAIATQLELHGVRWTHHGERRITAGEHAGDLGEWLSEDLYYATLWDPVSTLAFVHFWTPRGLQLHGVHALARKLVAIGLTSPAPSVEQARLEQIVHGVAQLIHEVRTR